MTGPRWADVVDEEQREWTPWRSRTQARKQRREQDGLKPRFVLQDYYVQQQPRYLPWVRQPQSPPAAAKTQRRAAWFCHVCGTDHHNGTAKFCRNAACKAARLGQPGQPEEIGQKSDVVQGMPRVLQELYDKHAPKAKSEPEQQQPAAAPPAQKPTPIGDVEKLEELKKIKATLEEQGIEVSRDLTNRIAALTKSASPKLQDPKTMLDAAARFVRNTAHELDQAKQKVERLAEAMKKAQAAADEAQSRATAAAAVHKDALAAYQATLPADSKSQEDVAMEDSTGLKGKEELFAGALASAAGKFGDSIAAKCSEGAAAEAVKAAVKSPEFLAALWEAMDLSPDERPHKKANSSANGNV